MKQNRTIWLLTGVFLIPFAWLVWSNPVEMTAEDLAMMAGALVTALSLQALMWKGHRQGRWLAHRCVTCERAMRRVLPGELRPPTGRGPETEPLWRCTHCGRLH